MKNKYIVVFTPPTWGSGTVLASQAWLFSNIAAATTKADYYRDYLGRIPGGYTGRIELRERKH